MILVLASRYDEAARDLVSRWPSGDALLMTCQDFLSPGWAFYPATPGDSIAVAAGRRIHCRSVTGVLTLRPCVLEQELTGVDPQDQRYVCAELNAFLIAWLSSLPCAVLNRPTATCLSGPNWRPERWILEAAKLGIPIEPRIRTVPPKPPDDPVPDDGPPPDHVCVIGSRPLNGADSRLAKWTIELAQRAGVHLLEARFRGGRLIWAGCWPDPSRPEIGDALIACLSGETQ